MKFSITDFFSKCDPNFIFVRKLSRRLFATSEFKIWKKFRYLLEILLKKSLMETSFFVQWIPNLEKLMTSS